jgi:hypothetical protein
MDFSKIDDMFSREIIRGGEVYLEGMLRVATSADQRASSLAGMFTATASASVLFTSTIRSPRIASRSKRTRGASGGAQSSE